MANYETVLIARQDVSAAQVESITDMAQEILTEDGGRVARREYWGLRGLAYRIKKNRKGHYVLLNYEAKAEAVHEMERRMRLHDDVLRYMTVRTEDLPEEPSVVLARRDERDRDRGGRGRDRDDRGPRSDRGPRGDRPQRDGNESSEG